MLIGVLMLSCSSDVPSTTEKKSGESINEFDEIKNSEPITFKPLGASSTGLDFTNKIFENNQINYYTYEYLFNGGGVSLADFDNDGLVDIFFTCNMGPNRIFKNNGNLKFEDFSKTSGINSSRDWCTGTTIVDVNQDGLMDIYVSRSGWMKNPSERTNLLYVNKGNFTFEEQAAKFGIADSGYSTQASFFDMDGDNDLDLYVMNHPNVFTESLQSFLKKEQNPPEGMSDKLYENKNGKFVDVSLKKGINNYGHGLGLITKDLNGDFQADIYVSNDYQQHDFLYVNNPKSGFKDESDTRLGHMAKFSMGVDAEDINLDGAPEIMTVEMMPGDNFRQKTNMANMNPSLYFTFLDNGLQEQEMHNVLQSNDGTGYYHDIAYSVNVAQTDWSWAPLFFDMNGDCRNDLFISNGYRRDVLDKDFSKKVQNKISDTSFKFEEIKDLVKQTFSKNVFFQNSGNQFDPKLNGTEFPAFNTNGAAYADLDNDGDLDIVCNNMESKAVIYENTSKQQSYLKIKFEGPSNNINGISAHLIIHSDFGIHHTENAPTKGFQSSIPSDIVIPGIDKNKIRKIEVIWSDGQINEYSKNLIKDNLLTCKYSKGRKTQAKVFQSKIKYQKDFPYQHKEKEFDDYALQVLLPYRISDQGPFAEMVDLDNDNIKEIVVGGARGTPLSIYKLNQEKWERQASMSIFKDDALYEDSGMAVLDFNNDGKLDIYVSRGSFETKKKIAARDVLFVNKGNYEFDRLSMPIEHISLSPRSADVDMDGDIDLFVGGGVKEGKYPLSYPSYILLNENGVFKKEILIEENNGLVKDAKFLNIDTDEQLELLVIGEWMGVKIFDWEGSKMKDVSNAYFTNNKMKGWWTSIESMDLDNDGIEEILLGNLGLNTKFAASPAKPFRIYSDDFDKNGSQEVVLAFCESDNVFPVRGKQCSSEQLPVISKKIKTYEEFASSDVFQIYGKDKLKSSINFETHEFRSGYLKLNHHKFEFIPFPKELQVSRIFDFEPVNNGTKKGFWISGNQRLEVETGLLDAFGATYVDSSEKTWRIINSLNPKFQGESRKIIQNNDSSIILYRDKQAKIVKLDY